MIGWAMLTVAWAQDPVATGSVQQLHTSVDSQHTVWTDDATVSRDGAAQGRALASYAARPVDLARGGDQAVVRSAWQLDLAAAFTVGRARLGVSLPLLAGVASDFDEVPSAGLADVALDAKYTVSDPEVSGLGFAALARIGVPVGAAGVTGLASEGPWLEATAVVQGDAGPVQLITNLGLRVGPPAVVDGQTVGDQLIGRFAAAWPLLDDRTGVALEVASRVGVQAPLAGTTPVEAGVTGWFRFTERLAVRGGVGRFVVDGYGASTGRFMVGLTSHPRSRTEGRRAEVVAAAPEVEGPPSESDRDQDGIVDGLDRCGREPEDLDGFQDGDGCPDDVQLGVRIQTRDGAIAHGAFAWLRCGGERVRLMPDELIDVPEGSCVLDASGIGWSAQRAMRFIDNGPPVEWEVELEPTQPMTRLVLVVRSSNDEPLEEVLWSVGNVYGRVTDGAVAMALPVGTYPMRVKARGTAVEERSIELGPEGARLQVILEPR